MTQNSDPGEDVRVQRSRAQIEQALFALTVEMGYPAVTVRDIATRAQVNRSTFYRHYLDKQDVLDQYPNQLQAQVAEAAARAERAPTPERVPLGLFLLVQHVQQHAAFYRVMLGKNGDQAFSHRLRQFSEQRYRMLFARAGEPPAPNDPPGELAVQFIAHAFVGALLWWLESDAPSSVEQFTVWLSQLSMATAAAATAARQAG